MEIHLDIHALELINRTWPIGFKPATQGDAPVVRPDSHKRISRNYLKLSYLLVCIASLFFKKKRLSEINNKYQTRNPI